MMTAEEVAGAPYVDLLAKLSESNRPPGGLDTICRMISATHLRPQSTVLHAGCNAGFLSREIVRRTGAQVTGVDISAAMVKAAQRRAGKEGLDARLSYVHADMRQLPFEAGSFDVVLSGGALAFVSGGREGAIAEWVRVVRPHGLIADCELFYAHPPPDDLLRRVSRAIGVDVPRYDLSYWLQVFAHPCLERYHLYVGPANLAVRDDEVTLYVDRMLARHKEHLTPEASPVLRSRLLDIFSLFNENMRYLSYALMVYVSRPSDFEPALYV